MDRDCWLKAMNQFSNICGASHFNNHILFFDGRNIHLYNRTLTQKKSKKIQPFIVKAGDSINDQPNGNGNKSTLNYLYNVSKANWVLKYGTMRFQSHQMNSILVETWEAFAVSAGNIIRDSVAKTHLTPLSPPNMITNTQACAASTQTSSKGITQIAEDSL